MADYITKESVHTMVRHLTKFAWASPINNERRITVDTDDVHFGVDKIPAADVAPVVRCKECQYAVTAWEGVYACTKPHHLVSGDHF